MEREALETLRGTCTAPHKVRREGMRDVSRAARQVKKFWELCLKKDPTDEMNKRRIKLKQVGTLNALKDPLQGLEAALWWTNLEPETDENGKKDKESMVEKIGQLKIYCACITRDKSMFCWC